MFFIKIATLAIIHISHIYIILVPNKIILISILQVQ